MRANMGIGAQALGVAPIIENLRRIEKSDGCKTKEELAKVVAKGYDFVINNL